MPKISENYLNESLKGKADFINKNIQIDKSQELSINKTKFTANIEIKPQIIKTGTNLKSLKDVKSKVNAIVILNKNTKNKDNDSVTEKNKNNTLKEMTQNKDKDTAAKFLQKFWAIRYKRIFLFRDPLENNIITLSVLKREINTELSALIIKFYSKKQGILFKGYFKISEIFCNTTGINTNKLRAYGKFIVSIHF